MSEEPAPKSDERQHVSAEEARGGEIILRTRRRRIVFIVGLAGIVLLFLLLRFSGLV